MIMSLFDLEKIVQTCHEIVELKASHGSFESIPFLNWQHINYMIGLYRGVPVLENPHKDGEFIAFISYRKMLVKW